MFGENNTETLHIMNNLAYLYNKQEKFDLSESLLTSCLQKYPLASGFGETSDIDAVELIKSNIRVVNDAERNSISSYSARSEI